MQIHSVNHNKLYLHCPITGLVIAWSKETSLVRGSTSELAAIYDKRKATWQQMNDKSLITYKERHAGIWGNHKPTLAIAQSKRYPFDICMYRALGAIRIERTRQAHKSVGTQQKAKGAGWARGTRIHRDLLLGSEGLPITCTPKSKLYQRQGRADKVTLIHTLEVSYHTLPHSWLTSRSSTVAERV